MREAVSLATLDGLEGLSIGNLASALEMSKSGLYADFGSKQELQLATVDEAKRVLPNRGDRTGARGRAGSRSARRGVRRILRSPDAAHFPRWVFLCRRSPRDGHEAGTGQRSDRRVSGSFTGLIRDFVVTALEQHELSADEDPDALTFELNGIILAANSNFVLRQDPAALDIARTVVRRRLGITTTSSPLPQRRAPTRSPKKTRGNEPNATPRRSTAAMNRVS